MTTSHSYRAAVARRFGSPDVLKIEELQTGPLAPGTIRVAPLYSGLNPVNARIRAGKFGGSVPYQPGTEFLGEVVEVGAGVSTPTVGDVVQGFGTPASNADLVITAPSNVIVVPEGADLLSAAGIGAVGLTAITVLDSLHLTKPSRIAVHGGAGGVGSVFVQLAVAAGHTVVATASEANQEYLRSLGAVPVVYGPGLAERMAEASPEGYDAVVDMVGTTEAGDHAASVRDAGGLAVAIVPETARSHGLPLIQVRQSQAGLKSLLDGIADGTLVMPVESIPFTEIVRAHERLDAGHARGKSVLEHRDNPYLNTLKEN